MRRKLQLLVLVVLMVCLFLPAAQANDEAKLLGERILFLGSQGEDVLALEKILVNKGFLQSADLVFGPETERAVLRYQSISPGLYPYGVADLTTLAYLLENDRDYKQVLGWRSLSLGSQGEDVSDLQGRLLALGYSLEESGLYDQATEKAVFAYQDNWPNLYAYGQADFATLRQLLSEDRLKVSMLIPGSIDDGGFMEAGYQGLLKIREDLGATGHYLDKIKPNMEDLSAALIRLAKNGPDMIIAHGGQCSQAAEAVAKDYPDIEFVVVQGHVTGDNLSSYEVLQEESTWLAGAAAGLLTESNVVGHISGIRVVPGLKGRAAFADGLAYTNPEAEFLTNFCGFQDDNEISRAVAEAEIAQGADIIFTMLNAGRQGATDAMREEGVKHIGNVVDWTKTNPDVFLASAIANVSLAGYEAAKDYKNGDFMPGSINKIGLENRDAVRLALNSSMVDDALLAQIDELAKKIQAGEITVKIDYDGPEFEPDLD